jgi:hypothetical protein
MTRIATTLLMALVLAAAGAGQALATAPSGTPAPEATATPGAFAARSLPQAASWLYVLRADDGALVRRPGGGC